MTEILGRPPEPTIVEEVHARCGGNPFLVEEVIAAGVDGRSARLSPRLQDLLLARTTASRPRQPRCSGHPSVARG